MSIHSRQGQADGQISQALYTWAKSLINQTKGVGFCAISAALVTEIDWLSRMKPAEFNLFDDNVTGAPELFAAREGFSEIGRMTRDDRAIIYRKTADGTVDDAKRPQAVVHAIIGDATALGLSKITRIRPDFWICEVDGAKLGALNLTDVSLSELLIDGQPEHSCPDGHQEAKALLEAIADLAFAGEGVIESLDSDISIDAIFLAFPREVADGFSLDPYVTIGGIKRQLTVRAPANPGAQPQDGASDKCQLTSAGRRSARQYLYVDEPSIGKYAQNVLDLCGQAPGGNGASPTETPASTEEYPPRPAPVDPGAEPNPVWSYLEDVRDEARPLTELENRALLSRLKSPGGVRHLLSLPNATLAEIFLNAADRNLLWEWSRLFKDVEADKFIDLWNGTYVAAFLGIVLIKNLAYPDGKIKIYPHPGLDPAITASVLRSMRTYDYGSRSLASVIERGLGSDEAQRRFIARTFVDYPEYLYGSILPQADVPVTHMIDYIRFCFDPWVTYRRLPPHESAALRQMLRTPFIRRLKMLLGR